jgi:hypothetical protein
MLQALADAVEAYVPWMQAVQDVPTLLAEYVPGAHVLQADAFTAVVDQTKVPRGQGRHCPWDPPPHEDALPVGQGAHAKQAEDPEEGAYVQEGHG